MKFTRRQNNEMMADVRITFTVGLDDLVVALIRSEWMIGVECHSKKTPQFVSATVLPTRSDVESLMRDRLQDEGPWDCGSMDDYKSDARPVAEALIRKLFPEIK